MQTHQNECEAELGCTWLQEIEEVVGTGQEVPDAETAWRTRAEDGTSATRGRESMRSKQTHTTRATSQCQHVQRQGAFRGYTGEVN